MLCRSGTMSCGSTRQWTRPHTVRAYCSVDSAVKATTWTLHINNAWLIHSRWIYLYARGVPKVRTRGPVKLTLKANQKFLIHKCSVWEGESLALLLVWKSNHIIHPTLWQTDLQEGTIIPGPSSTAIFLALVCNVNSTSWQLCIY